MPEINEGSQIGDRSPEKRDVESLNNLFLQLEQIQWWLTERVRPVYQEVISARSGKNAELIAEKEQALQNVLENSAILLAYTGEDRELADKIEKLRTNLQASSLSFDLPELLAETSDLKINIYNLRRE